MLRARPGNAGGSHHEAPRAQTDRELVEEFRCGSNPAYEAIYRAYRGRVTRTCRRYLHDDRDVEEAVQDTFTRAYLALGRFNGQFRLGAWLCQIAANVSLDRRRRRARELDTTALEAASNHPDSAAAPDALAGEQDLPRDVLRAMKDKHVHALLLRAEGYSYEEIAAKMGASPAQTKALLHRARESFKRAWHAAGTATMVTAFAVAGVAGIRLMRIGTAASTRLQTAAAGTAGGGGGLAARARLGVSCTP